MSGQDYEQLTLFQEDSPANRFLSPGSEEARMMTVTSGRKCSESYTRSGPLGCLVKMCLESSIWHSTRCFLTWQRKDTKGKHLLFRLVPSMPRTEETELQFWPTPTARDYKGANSIEHLTKAGGGRNHMGQLPNAVKLYCTPTARDWKNATAKEWDDKKNTRNLNRQIAKIYEGGSSTEERNGQLNPTWVEWLMGYPTGWTELNASETQ